MSQFTTVTPLCTNNNATLNPVSHQSVNYGVTACNLSPAYLRKITCLSPFAITISNAWSPLPSGGVNYMCTVQPAVGVKSMPFCSFLANQKLQRPVLISRPRFEKGFFLLLSSTWPKSDWFDFDLITSRAVFKGGKQSPGLDVPHLARFFLWLFERWWLCNDLTAAGRNLTLEWSIGEGINMNFSTILTTVLLTNGLVSGGDAER